jgi:hypothetical protein
MPYFLYGHGIYLDEGSSGITIEYNWVYETFASLFVQVSGASTPVNAAQ